jgi:hypothetical protein
MSAVYAGLFGMGDQNLTHSAIYYRVLGMVAPAVLAF